MNIDLLRDHIIWAEGYRQFPYKDSVGILTVGVGRNLEALGISRDEAGYMLDNDIRAVIQDATSLPYWEQLDGPRQMVIVDMIFNLGLPRFLKFKNLNRALTIQDYVRAAHEMLDSKWYRQVGRRAEKLRQIMLTGVWKDA